jgi:hypothetical protein
LDHANFIFVKPAASKLRTCDKKTDSRPTDRQPPTLELPRYGPQKLFPQFGPFRQEASTTNIGIGAAYALIESLFAENLRRLAA